MRLPPYGVIPDMLLGARCLVDADYVAKSGGRRYAVGERLVVSAGEVRRLAAMMIAEHA